MNEIQQLRKFDPALGQERNIFPVTKVTAIDGVDDEPIAGSDNLVKSGGVAEVTNALSAKLKYEGVTLDSNTNQMVPELYITGLDKTKSYSIYNINKGNASRSVNIYDINGSEPDIFVAYASTTDFSKDILQIVGGANYPNISGWIVVNWDNVPEGNTNLFSEIRHEAVSVLANNPRIASEIQISTSRDDLNIKINGAIGDIGVIPSSSYFNGYYNTSNGKPSPQDDGISVFSNVPYKVEGGASYRILGNIKSYLVELTFYDADDVYLGGSSGFILFTSTDRFTVPALCRYIRVAFRSTTGLTANTFEGNIRIISESILSDCIVDDLFIDDSKKALAASLGNRIADIESNVNSVVGGTIRTKYGVEDLGILNDGKYINSSSGIQLAASTCIITNSIYLEAGDFISAYTGGTAIAVIAKSESKATTSTVFTPVVSANNMDHPVFYKVEEAGHYAFSGRNQQQGNLALVVEVLKHSESEGIIDELDELVNGEPEIEEYTLEDLQGEGAMIGYYLHYTLLRADQAANCIITKPLYLHSGDRVSCSTGGSGILLLAKSPTGTIDWYTTNYESISGTAASYVGVIEVDGWYVFSGRINRTDGTNLVVNVTAYKRGESLQEKLDKKVDKSDIASLAGGSGYALSVGADAVKDAVPVEPWFDEVSNDGTTYGTYLDDKIDSVPEGDSFIFISDVHYFSNHKQSAKLIDYVRRRLGIKTVIHGGDVINEASTIAAAAEEWLDFNRDFVFRIGGDFKQVCGDHDHNGRYADTGQAFSYQFVQRVLNGYNIKELHYDTIYDEQIEEIAVVNNWSEHDLKEYNAWKKMHYFFDDSTIKTRFIVLHTGWSGDVGMAVDKLGSNVLSETFALYLQMDFLYQSLLSVPSNYNVVVTGHNAIGNKGYSTTVDGTTVTRYNVNELIWKGKWQQIAKMLRAFKNKSSVGLQYRDWSGSGVQTKLFDFASANTPNIVFCIGGDVHWDIIGKSTENSETLEPIAVATSLDHIIVTEGSLSASDIPHIITMTDGGDRVYRGIIAPIGSGYDDSTDSVRLAPSNTVGTLDSQAFDIVTIMHNEIYLTRIGSGSDRIIHIE